MWHKEAGLERLWERKRRQSFGDLAVLGLRRLARSLTQGPGVEGLEVPWVGAEEKCALISKEPKGSAASNALASLFCFNIRKIIFLELENTVLHFFWCVCGLHLHALTYSFAQGFSTNKGPCQLKQCCYSNPDRMVLAQKQNIGSMGWGGKPRDKSMHVAP